MDTLGLDIASPKESSENRIILKLPALSDRKLHGAILFVLTSGPFFATQALPNEKDTRIGMNRAPFMGATRGERPASALTIQVTPPDIVSRRSADGLDRDRSGDDRDRAACTVRVRVDIALS